MSPTLPWSVAWISPVLPSSSHSSTFENMTWSPPFILSFRRCVCFITSTFGANMKNMKCLWNTSAFCANISTPPGRGHSGWSLRGPQRHHCQCTCERFFYFCRLFHIIPSVFPFELILLSTSSQSSIFVHIIFISLLDYSSGGETSHHALCLKNINE